MKYSSLRHDQACIVSRRSTAFSIVICALFGSPGLAVAQAGWEKQWEALVEAGNREGQVNVIVPPGPSFREGVTGFSKAFPSIKLNVISQHIRDALPRILREREAGINSADVMVGAVGAGVFREWIPKGILAPLKPALIHGDVLDDSKWLCGLPWGWMDKGKVYNIGFSAVSLPGLYVNRDMLSEAILPDGAPLETLMKAELRGKISWNDPRELGSGQNIAALFLRNRNEQFLRDFVSQQKPIFTRDERQQVDWIARGRYPVAMGLNTTILADFQKEGIGKNVVALGIKDADMFLPGFGVMALFDKAAHPNAAMVFANWLLTREGQEQYHRAAGENSRRIDVPAFNKATAPKNLNCGTALDLQKEEFADLRSAGGKVSADAYEKAR